MNFEKPEQPMKDTNPIEKEDVIAGGTEEETRNDGIETERNAESVFGKSLRCFKRWSGIGTAIGAILVVGELARENHENDHEYDVYISATLSGEGLREKESADKAIAVIFGEEAVRDIKYGDQSAFFERQEKERKEPTIHGFSEHGWTNMQTYAFTEKHLLHPKGWVAGEVGEVRFIDSLKHKDSDYLLGGQMKQNVFSKPTIYLFRTHKISGTVENYAPIEENTIEHEFAHANDWRTDMDLGIRDRQDLLLCVFHRLQAPDSWHRDIGRYHETFVNGTKEGLYKSAIEYWAEICAGYFTDPVKFQRLHPNDFNLVDTYAKINDPTFDIFNKSRGAFDTTTGELKEIWKGK